MPLDRLIRQDFRLLASPIEPGFLTFHRHIQCQNIRHRRTTFPQKPTTNRKTNRPHF
jgi:hypothetical protein